MADIDSEIAAFEGMRPELEAHHVGEWVLIQGQELVGSYSTFDEAAEQAVGKFGRGPFLIRQVGAPPVVLPASVMYNFVHA